MKTTLTIALNVCFVFICHLESIAQAGKIDSLFGGDGIVTTSITGNLEFNRGVVVQEDGKIIDGTISYVLSDNSFRFLLIRYNYDGQRDKTFGKNGIVNTSFKNGGFGQAINLQKDGKILLAGTFNDPNNPQEASFGLGRYNKDGSVDMTFGKNGIALISFKNGICSASSIAIQIDGKIIIGGTCSFNNFSETDFALVRYNNDGSADTNFGKNGKVLTPFANKSASLGSVGIDKNGRIFLAGSVSDSSNNDMALICYKANGSLDTTFGKKGKIETDFNHSRDFGNSMAVLSNGKIIVTGSTNPDNISYDFALVRYNSNGSLDTSFGTNGKVSTDFDGSSNISYGMKLQQDEKIVMSGQTLDKNTGKYHFLLARYNNNGSLDDSFGQNGFAETYFSNEGASAYSIAISPDQKIVVAGDIVHPLPGDQDPLLVRYIGSNNAFKQYANLDVISKAITINLYPNPVQDAITIKGLTESRNTIAIFDTKGQTVYSTVTSSNTSTITVKSLARGLYYVKINNGEKATILKFIKE